MPLRLWKVVSALTMARRQSFEVSPDGPATLHACRCTLTVAMTFPGSVSSISSKAAGWTLWAGTRDEGCEGQGWPAKARLRGHSKGHGERTRGKERSLLRDFLEELPCGDLEVGVVRESARGVLHEILHVDKL